MQMYPGWNARDNYGMMKKKKRKKEKTGDGGTNFLFVAALERGIGALADARAWATTDALGGGKFPDFRPRENEV